ncbi:hypothetical protein MN202_16895 [Rheinheimera muenzenbergensis]|uniref:Cytochrome c domain-containing protein n=1 Tax=Rheinheimera muenzenbergensis TaxID=1193628 RepID=A0ABU8CBN6_9GAMM
MTTNFLYKFGFAVLINLTIPFSGNAQKFPDVGYEPPSDWNKNVFKLSQDYPTSIPKKEKLPWEHIDFRKEPERYLWSVLDYSYEGNVEVDFVVENNKKRKWYHAPWLHYGNNGREFVRGLTRERTSRAYELASTQTEAYRNYAVGFYDERGGFVMGQVWDNPTKPNPKLASFPEGTVSFKLLFTTAPHDRVPFLDGSPEWVADIDKAESAELIQKTKVRLLQIDIAVKDKRSLKGGWIFGTFHYDSAIANLNPWRRLRALSLMWGDDPKLLPDIKSSVPAESWVNQLSPIVKYRSNPPSGVRTPSTLGWAGRANGPVDNSASSCMSCHGTAQLPASSGMIPPANANNSTKLTWFRNLKPGKAFDSDSVSLDYSLQLGLGIQNLYRFQASINNMSGFYTLELMQSRAANTDSRKPEFLFTRDPQD